MKIAVMSDLHGNLPEYNFEGVELLLICGDVSPLDIQFNIPKMQDWLCSEFTDWCVLRDIPKVIFIAGNHDIVAEREDDWMHERFPKSSLITYLKNEVYDYISEQDSKVYRIFGTPYCKQFGNWAFMRDYNILKEKFAVMPDNVDILISHDAPRIANLGCILEGFAWYGEEAGNPELAQAIKDHKPKYAFCGHIHSGEHRLQDVDGTKMANTSIVNERYEVVNDPLILEV